MGNCTFCELYEGGQGILYDNGKWYARLDRHPVTPGHLGIVPVRHVESVFELTGEEMSIFVPTLKEVIDLIHKMDFEEVYEGMISSAPSYFARKFSERVLRDPWINEAPSGFNIGVNEGEYSGEMVDHVNFHVIPRYKGNIKDFTGGIRNVIPGRGNYHVWYDMND